jgi:predicted RNase H-like nuclease (RuvC/YqgF family)
MIEELTKLKKQNRKLKEEVNDLRDLLAKYEARCSYYKNSYFDKDTKINTLEWIVDMQKGQIIEFKKQIDELIRNSEI